MCLREKAIVASRIFEELDARVAGLREMVKDGMFDRKATAAAEGVSGNYANVRLSCVGCGAPPATYTEFIVKDELWQAVVGRNVNVCLPCFEREIGREVEESDLKLNEHGEHFKMNQRLVRMMKGAEKSIVVDNENERAKQVAENENYYARIMQRALNRTQRETLEKIESGEEASGGTAYGVCSDPVAGVRKYKRNQNKQNHKRGK